MSRVFALRGVAPEVFYEIVSPYAVNVMNHLSGPQVSSDRLLHHEPMLKHVTAHVGIWMVWKENKHVSVRPYVPPARPRRVVASRLRLPEALQPAELRDVALPRRRTAIRRYDLPTRQTMKRYVWSRAALACVLCRAVALLAAILRGDLRIRRAALRPNVRAAHLTVELEDHNRSPVFGSGETGSSGKTSCASRFAAISQ